MEVGAGEAEKEEGEEEEWGPFKDKLNLAMGRLSLIKLLNFLGDANLGAWQFIRRLVVLKDVIHF